MTQRAKISPAATNCKGKLSIDDYQRIAKFTKPSAAVDKASKAYLCDGVMLNALPLFNMAVATHISAIAEVHTNKYIPPSFFPALKTFLYGSPRNKDTAA